MCGRVAAEAVCSSARAHSHEKPRLQPSLPAREAASTVDTVAARARRVQAQATRPSALQAPVQRVQVSSSPTA